MATPKPFIREGRTGIDTALDAEELLRECDEDTVAGRLAVYMYECEVLQADELLSVLRAHRFDIRERNKYDRI